MRATIFAMANHPGIYVETLIRKDIDQVWRRTQDPALHELWDLRFSRIKYLPRGSEKEPQRFLYSTRIGFGLNIEGEGESTGTHEDGGVRISALKFWSADPKSLIETGSGYWKYVPTKDGVRFFTWYDYQTRFAALGGIFDRLVFRPLLGWATAWSFDRLRIWIDRGQTPAASFRLAMIHATARVAIAFIWFWHGLVPKLLFEQADERSMIAAVGLSAGFVPVIGWIELVLAALAFVTWRWRPFFLLNVAAMIGALVGVALTSPSYLVAAFNPVTLDIAMIALSVVGFAAAGELPYAARCLRKPPKEAA